jgi:hypothetical protein
MVADGWFSQEAVTSKAASAERQCRNKPVRVVRRRNAKITFHEKPTVCGPDYLGNDSFRPSSSSSIVSAMARALSHWNSCPSPNRNVCCTNFPDRACFSPERPARTASFRAVSKEIALSLITSPINFSTSGSRVTVVLILLSSHSIEHAVFQFLERFTAGVRFSLEACNP